MRLKISDGKNLEAAANGSTRRQAIAGVAIVFGGFALGSTKAWAAENEEGDFSHCGSHSPGACHQS